MESKYTEIESLFECRFSSIILLFRLAGISLKIKRKPIIYSLYVITVIVCSCSTFIGMFIDAYLRTNDLRSATRNACLLFGITNVIWIWIYCR
jgi:hypothetical protein